ncbi:MAG: c-type cytochrome [Polyangiales bacterium]
MKRRSKRGLIALGVFSAVIGITAAVGVGRFVARRDHRYITPAHVLPLANDPATLARGEHLARTVAGCAECHGDDFAGKLMDEDVMLRAVAPNLTLGAGSAVRGYDAASWSAAIRGGVNRAGHSLIIMPSRDLAGFSDADLGAVASYLRSLPPVDRMLAPSRVKPLGMVVLGLVGAPIFSAEEAADAPPPPTQQPVPGPTRAYGEYLMTSCRGCHGADLRGGLVTQPGTPPSADLSPNALKDRPFASFERALRQGVAHDGHVLHEAMPWRAFSGLSDDELRAIWIALRQDES